jgi:hypothetical protein
VLPLLRVGAERHCRGLVFIDVRFGEKEVGVREGTLGFQ